MCAIRQAGDICLALLTGFLEKFIASDTSQIWHWNLLFKSFQQEFASEAL